MYATVKNRVAQFKRGDFSTCDAPRTGRPKTVITTEIIDQIHQLISEDRWISAKQLGISGERVGSITHEDVDMRKLSAKWVPKCLNADQKRQRYQFSEPNHQRRVLLISAGATEGHFEGNTPREGHQGGLVLARQRPGSTGAWNPEETGLPGLP